MVIQTRDNGDLDHTVIRGSDKNLSYYKNILKKGSTGFHKKLVMQDKGKRIVIDDSKDFGLNNYKGRGEINQV